MELGLELLPHLPYSPDLAPSDYHLFRSLEHTLRGTNFNNVEEVKAHLEKVFNAKSKDFFEKGIEQFQNSQHNNKNSLYAGKTC